MTALNQTQTRRHGCAYDRGAADSYYRRRRDPHYYKGGSYTSECVPAQGMTPEEVDEYNRGFDDNEYSGDHKEWR